MPSVSVDTSGLQKLARDLRRAAPELLKETQTAMKKAGTIAEVEARLRANYSSSRIGATVRTKARGLNVILYAGGARAPHAAAFEHNGVPGSFRHPVFGNRENWVSQQAHPYLLPAAIATQPETERAMLAAVDAVLLRNGFH